MKRKTRLASLLTLAVLLAASASPARADLIYNNFGPGDTYDINQGWALGFIPPSNSQDIATRFTVSGGPFFLDTISLALGHISGPNVIQIWLMSAVNDLPGTILESWTLTSAMGQYGQSNPPVTVTSALNTLLDDGATYYVAAIAEGNTVAAWNWNSTGDSGPFAFRQGGGPWASASLTRGAMRVEGEPVPEPASLALLATGVFSLAGYGWRRRQAAV